MMNFKDTLIELLKSDERFLIDWELSLNHVKDSIDTLDEGLLDLLYNNEQTREKFFEKNKNSDYIKFKSKDFKFFLDENKLDNSYTQFENQIGLFFDNKLLKNRWEVVLNFPFKDCILEWGQSRDDWEDVYFEYSEKTNDFEEKVWKRKEVFFNEVLWKDEIDRLKEDKVLVNWKRFTKNWEEKVWEIKRDENGLIRENLIIKWNNLLALHSLKKEFSWKIKLIYIDPPYNTWNDSFKYNDNFNHSTWLTFMKNRLEVAKELLRDDWVIFVQCDTSRNVYWSPEMFYLWILMDEIFWRNNFIWNLHWKKKKQPSFLSRIAWIMESILIYSKNEQNIEKLSIDWISDSNKPIINSSNNFSVLEFKSWVRVKAKVEKIDKWEYLNKSMKIEFLDDIYVKDGRTVNSFKVKAQFRTWQDNINKFIDDDLIFITSNLWLRRDLSEDEKWKEKAITDLLLEWGQNQDADNEIKELFDLKSNTVFSNPKPELLLFNLIKSITDEDDIVLDYHLWSGTTCSVAHKMWRQYIGVEQMGYIENVSVERLKKVIDWEQWWISKEVNWKWGWEFIYVELKKWNEEAKEKIMNCGKFEELEVFFDEMYNKYFLNYNVKVRDFKEKILKDEKFRKLSLEKQKKMFVSMLDLNQMYVNMSERKDKKFGISDEDVKLSEEFYSLI